MKKKVLFGLFVLVLFSHTVEASLIGDDVIIQRTLNTLTLGTSSIVVVSDAELSNWNDWGIDISEYSISMDSISNTGYAPHDFNGFIFSSLDFGSSDEIISSISVTGIDQSRVSFSEHTILLNFAGLGFSNTQSINIGITTSVAPVPEPSTLLLMSTALIGIFGKRCRGKKLFVH